MPDIKKVIENPDMASPKLADRKIDIQDWDEKQGELNASQEGIELTEEHRAVVYRLHDYYLAPGARSGQKRP